MIIQYIYGFIEIDLFQFQASDFDLNSDVNVLDIVLLVDFVLNSEGYNPIGDLNEDGVNNILDIVTVVSFAIYEEEPNESQFWASDINNDGLINILDIVQLINIVLGN